MPDHSSTEEVTLTLHCPTFQLKLCLVLIAVIPQPGTPLTCKLSVPLFFNVHIRLWPPSPALSHVLPRHCIIFFCWENLIIHLSNSSSTSIFPTKPSQMISSSFLSFLPLYLSQNHSLVHKAFY